MFSMDVNEMKFPSHHTDVQCLPLILCTLMYLSSSLATNHLSSVQARSNLTLTASLGFVLIDTSKLKLLSNRLSSDVRGLKQTYAKELL